MVTVSQNKKTNSSSELENDIPFECTSDSDEDFEDGYSTSEFDLDESDNQQESELDAETEYLNNFTYQILKWSATSNCSREKLDELLAILKTAGGHSDPPKDIRTLIGTPRDISSVLICGGEYIYDGILKGIIESFSSNPILKESEILKLDVNIDGLPLCKSSKSQLWPIIGSINSCDYVFTIAIFHGYSKPNSVDEFLFDFINESNEYVDNSISINGIKYAFQIRVIIRDAPARAFIKCIFGHTGYFSCERCQNKGQSYKRRIVYTIAEGNDQLRMDIEFSQMKYYLEHQKQRSPLLDLHNFKCVSQIPLDYMHLILQGVVKRMLIFLMKGPKNCRISKNQISEILIDWFHFLG